MKKSPSLQKSTQLSFAAGLKDGLPVALGYLAVSFSLGIAAKKAGLDTLQSFLVSLFCMSSTGEYAGFTLIAAGATLLELAVITLIANARYLLMSCALSQRVRPGSSLAERFLMSLTVTDELFALNVAQPGYLRLGYALGALTVAAAGWSVGTALGTVAGSMLPVRLVSAFSVALYGMFLAVIIPPARKERKIAALVAIGFAASYAAATIPALASIPEGTRIIVLTVSLSAGAALLFPREEAPQ